MVRLHIQNNERCANAHRSISFSGNPLFFCIPIRTFTLTGCFAVPGFDTGFLAVLRAGRITFFIRAGFGATFGFGLRTCPISLIGVLSMIFPPLMNKFITSGRKSNYPFRSVKCLWKIHSTNHAFRTKIGMRYDNFMIL